MATEWVKMRVGLRKHPKTIAMARILMSSRDFVTWLSRHMRYINHLDDESVTKSVTEFVTREIVTRVTVSSLIEVWGAVNTSVRSDLRVPYMQLDDLDGITGIPSFGQAMEAVGWVREFSNDKTQGLLFPNFSEFNNPESERARSKTPAERAAEYRARKKAEDDASRSVTFRHAASRVVDQNRVDLKDQEQIPLYPPTSKPANLNKPAKPTKLNGVPVPDGFAEFWSLYPRKEAKPKAMASYAKTTATERRVIAQVLPEFVGSWKWLNEPTFIPHPTTWLNQRRWEDDPPPKAPPLAGRPVDPRPSRQGAILQALSEDHRYADTAARNLAEPSRSPGYLPPVHAGSGLPARVGCDPPDGDGLD